MKIYQNIAERAMKRPGILRLAGHGAIAIRVYPNHRLEKIKIGAPKMKI